MEVWWKGLGVHDSYFPRNSAEFSDSKGFSIAAPSMEMQKFQGLIQDAYNIPKQELTSF